MQQHTENVPNQVTIVTQIEDLFRQAFIMGERAILEMAKRSDLNEVETKELLISAGPGIGMEFLKQLTGAAQIIERATQKQIDEMVESLGRVLDEIRKRNRAV